MDTDYAQCINMDVLDNPNSWSTQFLDLHISFLMFSDTKRLAVAAEAADEVKVDCAAACPNDGTCTGLCDGCMSGIAYVYSAFSDSLDIVW